MLIITHIAAAIGGSFLGVIVTCLFVAAGRDDR